MSIENPVLSQEQIQYARQTEQIFLPSIPTSAMPSKLSRTFLKLPIGVAGLRMLDIAAGGSNLAAEFLSQGADIYAVDPLFGNRLQLKDAVLKTFEKQRPSHEDRRDRIRALEVTLASMLRFPERYKPGLATDLPFDDGEFDIAYSIAGILPYFDPEIDFLLTSIQEGIRVLKPGGNLQLYPFKMQVDYLPIEINQHRMANEDAMIRWLQNHPQVAAVEFYTEPVQHKDTVIIIKAA